MPIHQSRYNRTLGWDSAGGPSPRRPVHVQRVRDYRMWWIITLVASAVIILILSALCLYFFFRSRPQDTTTQTSNTTAPDTSSWKTFENTTVGLSFRYPSEWKFNTKDAKSTDDLLNIEAGLTTDEVNATFQVEALKNSDELSLADWVKEFGTKDVQAESTTLNTKSALRASFSNSNTAEMQDIYYVGDSRTIFVFDLYQSASAESVQKILQTILGTVAFSVDDTATPPTSKTSTPATAASLLVVNTVKDGTDDTIALYSEAGKKDDDVFTDADLNLLLKGGGDVAPETNTLFGYFGQSGLTSQDGIYMITLDGKTKTPKKLLADITPGIIRVSQDGKVIAYLNGKEGDADEIIILNAAGKQTSAVSLADNVVAFDLSADGKKLAVATTSSGVITIYTTSGDKEKSYNVSDDNILALDWNDVANSFVVTVDAGREASNATELYYYNGTKATRLTNDNFVQVDPRFSSDAKHIYYTSFKADAEKNKSIWQIGIDGKDDTNLLKSAEMTFFGLTQ